MDLDLLTAIDRQCFSPAIAYSRGEFASLLRSPHVQTSIAERSGQVAGFACMAIPRRGRSAGEELSGELITIDVLPEFRRERIGLALHAALERTLQIVGGDRMRLHVAVENTAAIAFYQRLQYTVHERIARYYPDGADAWRMEKYIKTGG